MIKRSLPLRTDTADGHGSASALGLAVGTGTGTADGDAPASALGAADGAGIGTVDGHGSASVFGVAVGTGTGTADGANSASEAFGAAVGSGAGTIIGATGGVGIGTVVGAGSSSAGGVGAGVELVAAKANTQSTSHRKSGRRRGPHLRQGRPSAPPAPGPALRGAVISRQEPARAASSVFGQSTSGTSPRWMMLSEDFDSQMLRNLPNRRSSRSLTVSLLHTIVLQRRGYFRLFPKTRFTTYHE